MDLGKRKEKPKFDLNLPVQDVSNELGFQYSVNISQKLTEFNRLDDHSGEGGDLRTLERDPDVELSSSSMSKRRRYSIEEKAKAKIDENEVNLDLDLDLSLRGRYSIEAEMEPVEQNLRIEEPDRPREDIGSEWASPATEEVSRRQEQTTKQRSISRDVAQRFAHPEPHQQGTSKKETARKSSEVDKELVDPQCPFSLAMEAIKKRNLSLFKWAPANNRRPNVPTLLDLCLNVLACNSDKIVSLENVPDHLRHKLSQMVCSCRKMDARLVELLARESPTEIRVRDASLLTEGDCIKIFDACDTKNLTVLQLDLCGLCMPDYVLLAEAFPRLPKLATISLRGAHRLSDHGLGQLAVSAPALQSINLSQCSLVTSAGINDLASRFESTLRELYIDDCQNIEAMLILPSLKKFKRLEVLSVSGIQTVTDDFVSKMVEACGMYMKELAFANCKELTDKSLEYVGKTCPNLCALDLSYLHNLTDSALKHLANGCRSICELKLCRNDFSDEAIAAFLEASGESLNVLSLNNISKVNLNTAESIAKCSRNLLSLDLSWCRKLTNEAVGQIVDSCSSLKELKLFGCTQITNAFLDGHSNSLVHIIGCKLSPILKHVDLLRPQEAPLRYSPLMPFADQQNGDSPDG